MINLRNMLKYAVAASLLQFGAVTHAADSLDALLKEVQSGRGAEQQAFEQAKVKFNAASEAEQQKMLQEAQARRDALAAKSKQLSSQFSENEIKTNELDKQLREKALGLGLAEIFGLAHQAAGDNAVTLEQSLISTQFPPASGENDRSTVLREFGASKKVPVTADIERLWFELQREMVASGQVAKYRASVIAPGGEKHEQEVIRIGPFVASSEGKVLQYLPSLRSLSVFPRQPPAHILSFVKKLESTSSGYVQAVVDSTRGVLMALYVERPTWVQRIEHGEQVNYVILLVGAVGVICFLLQLVYLILVRLRVSAQLKHLDRPVKDNPLGRVLLAFSGDGNKIEQSADVAELRIAEAVSREIPKLERFQSLLRLSVAAGPLLGLIGTVLGMIMTFQAITESGSGDPKLMAHGIGAAMIATVLGLGIAIPLLFANALLTSLSSGMTQVIEEQSAGMLAENIERQRRA
ncbi:MAG TPA: MotA/TolQ/ExbB proton channel family protein [Pseudomonadales bacterium]|nr:MotA/TolQ/ExbB proton channel family protein [Pseudomonadales bacterium]